jgi:hypothetical protein
MSDRIAVAILRGGAALALRSLAIGALIGAASVLAATCAGCSTGPQLPVVTTPINIACTWTNADGGVIEDNDCLIDRSSAASAAETTGNEIRDNTISPEVNADVSAIPGAP